MLDQGLDQAAGLRRLLLAQPSIALLALALQPQQSAAWVAQLARGLHEIGRQAVVVDAARGAVSGALRLRPRHDLLDLLVGHRRFDQVAMRSDDGIHVLRADRGIEAFVASGAPARDLLAGFAGLSHGFDDLLLAMPASELACLADPADTVPVLAIEADGRGVVESYGCLKQLAQDFGYRHIACVVTGAPDEDSARECFDRVAGACDRFLPAQAHWAGWLPAAGTQARSAAVALAASCARALLQLTAAPAPALAA